MGQNEGEVVVSPLAFTMIAMHSLTYPTAQVHGILIGSLQGSTVKVVDALPVCHESPTKPLVESALAMSLSSLQDGSTIVGWYSVPELVGDGKPGAAELRIAAGLEAVAKNPVLVTVSKIAVEKLATADDLSGEELLEAFGKDFGKQWKERLVASISSKESSARAVQALLGEKCLYDLVDHWLAPSSTEWPRTAELQEKIKKHL
mmetsp:Transcript_32494/g.90493  ORF Transcript_32494/g.90493 Transcript_32494/m.90493 type:complete len:204 (+) Transcript_32494:103-714(+)